LAESVDAGVRGGVRVADRDDAAPVAGGVEAEEEPAGAELGQGAVDLVELATLPVNVLEPSMAGSRARSQGWSGIAGPPRCRAA
jgi:hypothetical protein